MVVVVVAEGVGCCLSRPRVSSLVGLFHSLPFFTLSCKELSSSGVRIVWRRSSQSGEKVTRRNKSLHGLDPVSFLECGVRAEEQRVKFSEGGGDRDSRCKSLSERMRGGGLHERRVAKSVISGTGGIWGMGEESEERTRTDGDARIVGRREERRGRYRERYGRRRRRRRVEGQEEEEEERRRSR